ncbi:MAG: alpha/beta hydrolase family protein, partial [Angustibacter sp.]
MIWSPESGTEALLELDQPGEVADAEWLADGTGLIIALSFQARTRLLHYSLQTHVATPFGPTSGTVTSLAVQADGAVWCGWSSAEQPPSIRRLHIGESGPGRELLAAPGPAAPKSVPAQDVWVPGPAGEIHALLRRPDTPGPHPVVLEIHGGPTAQDIDAFSAYPSAWVDHGFAVVQVNYRGSTGYGSAWRDALEDRVGHTELADIHAVRDHLVRAGLVDPQRIILSGASWGGYLTLLGLGCYPQSWAVGIAGVPVADYPTAYEDEMEGLKAFDRSLFGGSPQEVPDKYRDSSPLTYVGEVCAPVLILAGENDPRCPIRQIENYASALASRD